ncbi:uncharacterized protein LOC133913032 [Phragmites australis]|uniref:uncharacterized protein LOC133913032 n=1 Tax=Phragmites australis TaxID=29695 RepID=UPI002D7A1852|nr:uncharacterized protein LOC133913032 [Phragmites australis]
MDHGERRAGHRPAAKSWRDGVAAGGAQPPPPKVYRVEPRDFRELVQRLTGAETAAPAPAMGTRQRVTLTTAAAADNGRMEEVAAAEQLDYASWFSAPLFSPAYAPTGFDGHHGNGALL